MTKTAYVVVQLPGAWSAHVPGMSRAHFGREPALDGDTTPNEDQLVTMR